MLPVTNELHPWLFVGNPRQRSALEQLCQQWGHWSFAMTSDSLQAGSYTLLCLSPKGEDIITGAILFRLGVVDTEIMFIYVQPEMRQQGLATKLIVQMTAWLKTSYPKQESAIFEVRISNLAAQKLYLSLGMKQIALRKQFYSDREDALVFRLKLDD